MYMMSMRKNFTSKIRKSTTHVESPLVMTTSTLLMPLMVPYTKLTLMTKMKS